ncbi:MAG TPA: FliH/SctL family protein, partial [Sedimentisphaerales bacterium]|nr:FliH/SctL family protein [Sedimentisphaerales bacterium]
MAYECRIKVERPIRGVAPLHGFPEETFRRQIDAGDSLLKEQQAEIHAMRQARKALESGADVVTGLLERMIAGQAQQISHLAVEIARKILRSRIENADYAIEAVVQQALSKAPARHNVTVRLHPDDFAKCKEAQQQDGQG